MSSKAAIYLDANAGLPPLGEVAHALPGILGQLYNPSSTHTSGRQAKALLREARDRVRAALSELLGPIPDSQWIWTSGGTEGLQAAIRATLIGTKARVWFYTPVEHSGSLGWLSQVAHLPDCKAIALPVDAQGRVTVEGFEAAYLRACSEGQLTEGSPFLTSILWVNNETGVIQHQLNPLLQSIRARGGLSLVDAAQAWGKVHDSKVTWEDADWVAASGHKLGALSGTGVLTFSTRASPLIQQCPAYAGTQQNGLRAGTENLLGAWSLGVAAHAQFWSNSESVRTLRDQLESYILTEITDSVVQGRGAERVGNTLNVSFSGISKKALPLPDLLDLEGFCVSSGSACSSGVRKPSHVLKALGHSDELALATLRISLSPSLTEEQVLGRFFPALKRVVELSRKSK